MEGKITVERIFHQFLSREEEFPQQSETRMIVMSGSSRALASRADPDCGGAVTTFHWSHTLSKSVSDVYSKAVNF